MSAVAVACCQLAPQVGQAEANRAAARVAIAAAADAGARIVVLPELATSGYVFADRAEAWSLAETREGPTVSEWSALAAARELVIVGGLCERDAEAGVPRNSAVVIDPGGLRGVYRKAHLWDRETEIFLAGDAPPLVLDTAHGRLGVMVCYDAEFPEWVRLAALDGAELLCLPTNWPREPRPAAERPSEVVRVQAAASSNRIFVAACDRAGHERGVDWVNGTAIIGPDGFPLAGPAARDAPLTLLAHCELRRARDKRVSPRNDALADRRPELYGRLTG